MSDLDHLPEIPSRVTEEIASWRRVLGQTVGDKRGNFHRAAVDVSLLGANETALTRQVILNELTAMATVAGVEDDEAQEIIAHAVCSRPKKFTWNNMADRPVEPQDWPSERR